MTSSTAISVTHVTHRYGQRRALDDVTLDVRHREIFALLGPNGGGKTTLFRLLSTLVPLQQGEIQVLGFDVRRQPHAVRERIGVVFQAPSLDKKLTVRENLRYQAHLYGLAGHELRRRQDEMLAQLRLEDRADDLVETLSGGLRRRVELAKGMIHRPQVLLMDEPTTGVDPAARSDVWGYLERIRSQQDVTIVLTTHSLEEGEKADRLAILSEGRVVALDSPDALRATIGGDCITIEADRPDELAAAVRQRFGVESAVVAGSLRLQQPDAHRWIAQLVETYPGRVRSVTVGKPTLEDVFIARTGHRFWEHEMELSS